MTLYFTPRTNSEANEFNTLINEAGFSAEWNVRYNWFAFEEAEETIDELEKALTEIIDQKNINGHFEAE